MSWILPKELENEERFERELQFERDEARQILMNSGSVDRVVFTNCMIPLQIDTHKQAQVLKEEQLRWKTALALGATLLLLIGFCWVGCLIRDGYHLVQHQWEDLQSR